MEQDRQYICRSNIEVRSRDHCCRGKAISITFSARGSVGLVTQHAKRARRIILPSVARPNLPGFSALSRKLHDFRKKVIQHKIYFDFLYNFGLKHF
jgi:hypothetical protein